MEKIDWKNLGFGYSKADYNIRCWYRNGQWGELEVSDSEFTSTAVADVTVTNANPIVETGNDQNVNDGTEVIFS